ncbi:Purple acid phosphatase 15 [Coccomyxa sp. Obi]|nr:Purple acid phosphatase 15 [Coccomyxa sp. Obi]
MINAAVYIVLAISLRATGQVLPTPVESPVTVYFNQFQLGSNDMPLTQPPLAKQGSPSDPDQIHIALGGPGEMYVTWVTGNATMYSSNPQPPEPVVKSTVLYGLTPGNLQYNATGSSTYYVQNNTGKTANPENNFYVSPLIHTVLLTDLAPDTTYYYRVGDNSSATSAEYSFKTGKVVGEFAFPARIGLIADLGITSNSSVSLQHLAANKPEIALFCGDLCYADDYTADGNSTYYYPDVFQAGSKTPKLPVNASTYQPVWDGFGRFLQTVGLSTSVPFMTVAGNHEIERDSSGKTFQSWSARYPNAYKQSNSTSNQYYSFNYAGAHFVNLGAYDGPGTANAQYRYKNGNYPHTIITQAQLAWLEADLAAVNRSVTPWIVVQTHPPFYNTYNSHYKEVECYQQQIEDVLYKYGVDFIFFGHVHAYERSNPVYKFANDPCGPVHITIGDGGNIEGTYKQFIDTPPFPTNCSVPLSVLNAPGNFTPLCATAQVYNVSNGPQYCPLSQPYFSAYREPSFGHGILELQSPTVATFQWFRNQDNLPVVADNVTVVRNLTCANQGPQVRQAGI